jgi:hypothetical protein
MITIEFSIWLASKSRWAHLTKMIGMPVVPRVGEFVKFSNAKNGDYFAWKVSQVTYRENGSIEVWTELLENIDNRGFSFETEDEFDDFFQSYVAENWRCERGIRTNRNARNQFLTTDPTCDVALKEWAVICRALETGQQTILLRKGGIAEGQGRFRPEHERFWLYPTQFHQGAEQLTASAADLLAASQDLRTASGELVLRSLATVSQVQYLERLEQAMALAGQHGWSDDVVRQRFAYRKPGLFLFVLRVYRSDLSHEVAETAAMAGCKSWVDLPAALAEGRLQPVLTDEQFADQERRIRECVSI